MAIQKENNLSQQSFVTPVTTADKKTAADCLGARLLGGLAQYLFYSYGRAIYYILIRYFSKKILNTTQVNSVCVGSNVVKEPG